MKIKDGSIKIPIDLLTITLSSGDYSIFVTDVSIEADKTDSIQSEAEDETLLSFEGKTYGRDALWEQEICEDIKGHFDIYNIEFED